MNKPPGATSPFGIPYFLLFLLCLISIGLFVIQIIKYDRVSQWLIIIPVLLFVYLEAKERYDFYYERNVLPNAKGPVPWPTTWEPIKEYTPFAILIIVLIAIGPTFDRKPSVILVHLPDITHYEPQPLEKNRGF